MRKRRRQHFKENIRWYLWNSAKNRAKKRKLPFTISIDDIHVPKYCPVLGIQLCVSEGSATDASPTLDALDPSLGYTPDNINIISMRANRIKNDSTPEELHKIANWVESKLATRKDTND